MVRLVPRLHLDNLRGDLLGGLTAAVVALPLALAFGVASGAGASAGLYSAIFIGFFSAFFGGAPAQVSGPTGPITIVMAAIFIRFADEPMLAFGVVMLAGLIQILFGAFRLGGYINLVPFPVVSGFMNGIGCIILILQLAPLLGHSHPGAGVVESLLALPADLAALNLQALVVGAFALATVYLAPQKLQRVLPAPLLALVAGTFLVYFFLPDAPVLGEIPRGFPEANFPRVSLVQLTDMLGSALVLALLGSIDSLLVALVADGILHTQHDSDRELVGQGIGNLVAGLFGAIPGSGATMRTVVNVRAGGRTPISGMTHALILLALALGLGPIAEHIPYAVLAGILIKVGLDIIDWNYLRRIPRAPRAGVVIMVLVMVLTIFVDLIVAVGVGMVAASLVFVKRMSDLQLASVRSGVGEVPFTPAELAIFERRPGAIMYYQIRGPMSFGSAKGLTRRVAVSGDYEVLVLDLSEVPFVDTSASIAIEDILTNATELGLLVLLVGLAPAVRSTLENLKVLRKIPPGHCFDTRAKALAFAERAGDEERWGAGA